MSETVIARPYLEKFCTGCGIDAGCGDDLIVPWAIGVDKRQLGKTNIVGDVSNLELWFYQGSMDFLYSSHCLEDFENTVAVLGHWLSMLKRGGYLVLYLPDQQRYLTNCKADNTLPNQDHKHEHFSMQYVLECLSKIGIGKEYVVYSEEPIGIYSFALVIRKP